MNVKCTYIDGVMDGPYEQYKENRQLDHKGEFKNGEIV